MDLKKIQDFLVTLYTNKKDRDNFFANKDDKIKSLNCNEREKKLLISLQEKAVVNFSNTILMKRFSLIEERVNKRLKNIFDEENFNKLNVKQIFFQYAENSPKHLNTAENVKDFVNYIINENNKIENQNKQNNSTLIEFV